MIVYRKTEEESVTSDLIREVIRIAEAAASASTHETATELLIETGRLEAGVVDALFPDADGVNEVSAAARKATIMAAHAFVASWDGRTKDMLAWSEMLSTALMRLKTMPLPWKIKTRVPEGFAHYGLYPEIYIKAARDFFHAEKPEEAVCVGLRSIGTSLSAIVAAVLEESGCQVRSFTMRPKGHPFRRKARLTPMLEAIIETMGGSFLVVDEGPGLSGTSFASAIKKISSLGISADRIVLFPSWDPDGSSFISAEAREMWKKHRRYAASFEELWLKGGRLEKEAGAEAGLTDISAGIWRSMFYEREADYPATHPRHEKRKYLVGLPHQKGSVLLKFAGHGRYGRKKLERASMLADAGFGLPVSGICNGFLKSEFVSGRPVDPGELNQILLDDMSAYLAFREKSFRSSSRVGFNEFTEMVSRNITLGLGQEWARKASSIEKLRDVYDAGVPVEIDGRMMPIEWLLTPKGYKKADSLDHSADQFFPSSQDIAWDLASAIIEFDMSPMEQHYFISRYAVIARDELSQDRLKLYMVAYLAFKLGYSSFAAEELANEPDGVRFGLLKTRYASRLQREMLWLAD